MKAFSIAGFSRSAAALCLYGVVVASAFAKSGKPDFPRSIEQARLREEQRIAEFWAHAVISPRAIGEVAGVAVAVVDISGEPHILVEGGEVMRDRVMKVDAAQQLVALQRRDGTVHSYSVTNPREVKFPVVSRQHLLAPGTMELPTSSLSLPPDVVARWRDLSRDAKEKILLQRLADGMVVNHWIDTSTVISRRLLDEELKQRRRALRAKFIDSLTPEQRAKWENGAIAAYRVGESPEEYAVSQERAKAAEALREKVIASLTAEQLELYEQMRRGY